jgi:tetratricopeptide (TPR) repeat protein
LYYKIASETIKEGEVQEFVKRSAVLCKIGYLLDNYYQDYESAVQIYKQAIDYDELNYYAHFYYANFLTRIEQNYNEARFHYIIAVILCPSKFLSPVVQFLREIDKNPLLAITIENHYYPPLTFREELRLQAHILDYRARFKKISLIEILIEEILEKLNE